MAKIILPKEELLSNGIFLEEYLGKKIQSNESQLIVYNELLYKVLVGKFGLEREEVMKFFHDKKHDLPIVLQDLVYDENNNFYCYSMELLKDYFTLNDLLKTNIDLEKRKEIVSELIRIARVLEYFGYYFLDWHSKNFMFKDNLKFLDIDSCVSKEQKEYSHFTRNALLNLCMSVILGIDFTYELFKLNAFKRNDVIFAVIDDKKVSYNGTKALEFDLIEDYINGYTEDKRIMKRALAQKYIDKINADYN